MLKNGELAKNGFEALKDLDENNDGVFDAQDPLFNEVLLWIDEGSDGISHPEELFTLSEKSILSIDLVYENVNILDPRGHSILQASTATSSEGQILDIVDIWLLRDVQDSVSTEILPVPEDIAKLPDINGLGMVHSLHQSMVRDKTGSLKDMVTQFVSEPKRDVRLDLADKIIQAWTGETDKLKVLEAFYGRTYTGGKGPNAMKVIYSGYDSLVMLLYQCLMADSHFDSYYQSMRFDSSGKINLDNTAKLLLDNIAADKTKGEDTLIEFLSNMSTMTSLKRMDHEKFVETLGNANPKYGILANAGYGYVSFSKENESTIQGASSIENLFVVGSGNHNISGGNKDDTYLFSDPLGDNTITDPKGNAAIVLGEEISPDDIRVCSVFHEDSSGMLDIRITVAETKGSITIKGFSYSSTCSIVFADGVVANVLDFVAWTEISSPSELLELASNPRGYFRLTTDIDLEGIEWTPIGSSSAPFIGFFDGNGHVIENLIVDLPERDCVGLFGASKGVISGISVQNASVAGKDYVGTIVGRSEGSFADSAAEGINVSGRNYAGGLAGRAASVSGCSADGGAIRGGIFVGGLVGECSSVCDSRATAGVTGSNWVGGLAGHLASGGGAARCSAWGNVGLASDAASNSRAGGLIGRLESPAEDCFSTGNVATSSHAGGLVGYATSSITRCYTLSSSSNGLVGAGGALADSYFDRDLAPSAPASEPGGRSTADMQQASTYEGWDFESVWQIEPGSYPSLRGQGPSDSKPEVPEEKPSEPEVPELNEGDIASVEGLKAMQNNLMGDYRLVADIDLSGVDWTPIGDGVAPFFGSFDGNGYVIKNLSVDMPERDFVGLFGVSSGSLSNVSIDGVVLAGKNYTGAVVGKAEGIVQNPVITGEIGITGGSYVGGIVGYVKGNLADIKVEGIKSLKGIDYVGGVAGYVKGNVSDSGVSGIEEIVASSSCAGGLVGEVSGSLSNCFATENGVFRAVNNVAGLAGKAGSVSDSHVSDMEAIILDAQTGSMNAAGLVGQVQGETKNCTVSGIGSISGEGNRIAGLVGYGIGGIDGCEVSGISSLQGSTKVAGLVGDTYRAVVDCKVSSIGSISGMRDVAGLAGYAKLVSGCTVETIDSITSTKERAAGLTGSAETIESSSVRDVGMVTGGGYVGGLAGKAKNVSRSYADVPVAAKSAVGGLLGLAEEGGTVEACFAAGAVSSTSASGTSLGGLVGSLKGALRDSFSLGSVLAGAQTGGLVGVVGETGSIERCFTLSGNDSGLVGSGLYADSYFAWERSGGDASLPGARALSDLAFSSTYEGWDFGSVWQIEPGSLPSLRGVAASTVYVRELAAKLGVSEGSSEMGAVQPSSDEGAEEDQAGSPNSSDVPVGSSEPTVSTDEGDSTAPDGKEGPLEDLDEGSAEGQSSPDDAAPDALRFEGDLAA